MKGFFPLLLVLLYSLLFTPAAEAEWREYAQPEKPSQQLEASPNKTRLSPKKTKNRRPQKEHTAALDSLGLTGAIFNVGAILLFILGFATFGAGFLFVLALLFALAGTALSLMSLIKNGWLFWNTIGISLSILLLLAFALQRWMAATI